MWEYSDVVYTKLVLAHVGRKEIAPSDKWARKLEGAVKFLGNLAGTTIEIWSRRAS
jgi:hypothetical protein